MEYTKKRFIPRLLTTLLMSMCCLLMVSCTSTDERPNGTDKHTTSDENKSVADSDSTVATSSSPNPYLLSTPNNLKAGVSKAFGRGVEALQAERWDEAKTIFQSLTASEPSLSGPWVNLGIAHLKTGDAEQAESNFRRAIKTNALNFDAYNLLAILKREQGEFSEAEKIFQNSISKWSDNPEAHCNLGILYDLYLGELTKALHHYKTCESLTNPPRKQLRGWVVDLERRIAAAKN